MGTEVKAYPQYGTKFQLISHNDEVPTFEGNLAVRLVEHFGIIAGQPDGEDATGRQRMKLLEPNDAVVRACEIAELMVQALRARDWVVKAPSLAECEKQALVEVKAERDRART